MKSEDTPNGLEETSHDFQGNQIHNEKENKLLLERKQKSENQENQ